MILAAGLTPAWQQIMCFERLRTGAVNRAAEVHWCASGKVINAGMALSSLGVPSHILSPAGGWSGQAMMAELSGRQIPATWTPTQAATRICTTLLAGGDTTELVENAAPVSAAEVAAFLASYRQLVERADMVVLTGSLPTGTPATMYRDLLAATPCPAVLDARGPELLAALASRPRLVKPNRDELAVTVNRPLPDRASVISAMRELLHLGAQGVLVTHGKSAVWTMEGDQVWELHPPDVAPDVNPIGCGDCLAATLAWRLACGDALGEAARWGIAAAAENVTQLLPARLALARVEAWLGRIDAPLRIQ